LITAPLVLRVFIDQCVPASAGAAFKQCGHEVTYLREKIATNSPDPLVAAVAEANDAILVSLDADFRKIAKRHGVGRREFRKLSLIKLSCRESRCFERIVEAMSLIVHEWILAQESKDRRLFIEIMDSVIRTCR
jgi:predicted nuclease of predicted toxin-antitoxin system